MLCLNVLLLLLLAFVVDVVGGGGDVVTDFWTGTECRSHLLEAEP